MTDAVSRAAVLAILKTMPKGMEKQFGRLTRKVEALPRVDVSRLVETVENSCDLAEIAMRELADLETSLAVRNAIRILNSLNCDLRAALAIAAHHAADGNTDADLHLLAASLDEIPDPASCAVPVAADGARHHRALP